MNKLLKWIAILVIGACVGWLYLPWQSWWDRVVHVLAYPLLVSAQHIADPLHQLVDKKYTNQELQASVGILAQENERLLQENIELKALVQFQERSKDLAEFRERYALHNAVLAKILVRNFSDQGHYYLINRGARDGIVADMAAIYKFQLLGKVVEIFDTYSKVLLITDRQCNVAAITNAAGHKGIAKGSNVENRCFLTYVNHLAQIQNDDLVLSSGEGLVFPEGFCLGKVVGFETKELYHQVAVSPLIDLKMVPFCLLTNQEKIKMF